MRDRCIYPDILNFEEDKILVEFPDLEGCITFGESEEEALFNAKEVLEGYLYVLERNGLEIPPASKLKDIGLRGGDTIIVVDVWMSLVRDQEANKSVKKTLTIPKWLNDIAEQNKINLSHLLQLSLKEHLGLNK